MRTGFEGAADESTACAEAGVESTPKLASELIIDFGVGSATAALGPDSTVRDADPAEGCSVRELLLGGTGIDAAVGEDGSSADGES